MGKRTGAFDESGAKLVNRKLAMSMENDLNELNLAQRQTLYAQDVGMQMISLKLQTEVMLKKQTEDALPDVTSKSKYSQKAAIQRDLEKCALPRLRQNTNDDELKSGGMPSLWFKTVIPARDPFDGLLRLVVRTLEEKKPDESGRTEPGWWLRPPVDPMMKQIRQMQLIAQSRGSRTKEPEGIEPAVVFHNTLPFQVEKRKKLLSKSKAHASRINQKVKTFEAWPMTAR